MTDMSHKAQQPLLAVEEIPAVEPGWERWTRALGFGFVALVVIGLIGLLSYGLLNKGGEGGALKLNRDAPDFSLNLFSGGTFTLSENLGKPVVMNIWASWCDSCRDEAPVLEQGWWTFRDKGVVFVGVDVMDKREDALKFIEEFNVTYPNGPDESDIYFDYGTTGVPETFFINREGKIVMKFMGPMTSEQLSGFVEELLQ